MKSNDICTVTSDGRSTCQNGGTCLVSKSVDDTGTCLCASGYRGTVCQLSPSVFSSTSADTLPYFEHLKVNSSTSSLGLSLDFASAQADSLLLYAVNGTAFLAVELIDGLPRISYRQTDGNVGKVSVAALQTPINDGRWHHLEIHYTTQVRL